MTSAWIEPATFRFVAQQRNHCATDVGYLFFLRLRCHKVHRSVFKEYTHLFLVTLQYVINLCLFYYCSKMVMSNIFRPSSSESNHPTAGLPNRLITSTSWNIFQQKSYSCILHGCSSHLNQPAWIIFTLNPLALELLFFFNFSTPCI